MATINVIMEAMKPEEVPPPAKAEPTKSLLDKITADPEFINRGLTEAVEPVEPASPAPMTTSSATGAKEIPVLVEPIVLDRDAQHRVPMISLLGPRERPKAAPGHGKLMVAVVALVLVGGGVATAAWLRSRSVAVVSTPSPTPSPTATPTQTPSPTATPTPLPSPTATPVPVSVTAPAAAPTAEHPQAVIITSKSGLWLRSSPSSASRNNIIGWMPNGASISVDAVGDFWWHGTYKGEPGYFAVSYTQ